MPHQDTGAWIGAIAQALGSMVTVLGAFAVVWLQLRSERKARATDFKDRQTIYLRRISSDFEGLSRRLNASIAEVSGRSVEIETAADLMAADPALDKAASQQELQLRLVLLTKQAHVVIPQSLYDTEAQFRFLHADQAALIAETIDLVTEVNAQLEVVPLVGSTRSWGSEVLDALNQVRECSNHALVKVGLFTPIGAANAATRALGGM